MAHKCYHSKLNILSIANIEFIVFITLLFGKSLEKLNWQNGIFLESSLKSFDRS